MSEFREGLKAHPRLLVEEGDWGRVKERIKSDEMMRKMTTAIHTRAQEILTEPVIAREMAGPRMIQCAQRAVKNVLALAFEFKLSKERKFARRCEAEMLALAGFSDWNPGHFLDVGEILQAMAVGYDWCFEELSAESRGRIVAAIVEKGITPGVVEGQHWTNSRSNWSSVCYGGMAAAAIAIADVEPELAERVIARVLEKVPLMVERLAPDGAWPAGPTYWLYAMEFLAVLVSALEKAFGSAMGLDRAAGFERTGEYFCNMTTPSGGFFSYTDGDNKREMAMAMFYFASRFGRAEWLAFERKNVDLFMEEYLGGRGAKRHAYRLLPLAVLWNAAGILNTKNTKDTKGGEEHQEMRCATKSALYRGDSPVAVLRGEGGNIFVGVKGGYAASDHGHMDVGSFLIEAGGVRWALDLGRENYGHVETHGVAGLWNMEQDSDRWRVFRIGPHGHNILRIGHGLQNVKERADFSAFDAAGNFCELDLSRVYAGQVEKLTRAVKVAGNLIEICDRWSGARDEVRWQMITAAEVSASGREVMLKQAGKILRMKVLGDLAVEIAVVPAEELLKPHDSPHPGVKRITIGARVRDGELRVAITTGS